MTAFQVGRTYFDRSACDHECIFRFTITGRTAKTVSYTTREGKVQRRGVTVWDGVEQFLPFGRYSMCAIVRADKVTEAA
jgi:hypothetical protein